MAVHLVFEDAIDKLIDDSFFDFHNQKCRVSPRSLLLECMLECSCAITWMLNSCFELWSELVSSILGTELIGQYLHQKFIIVEFFHAADFIEAILAIQTLCKMVGHSYWLPVRIAVCVTRQWEATSANYSSDNSKAGDIIKMFCE